MSDLLSLAAHMSELSPTGRLPPVEKWSPAHCGEIDIILNRDGLWFHEGDPIARPELVRLFSTILVREDNEYFLVTPVEKMKIKVEDVPFVATSLTIENKGREGQSLNFRTNVGDLVTADVEHQLIFRLPKSGGDGFLPYLHVRRGLEARLSRPVYYELAELFKGDPPSVKSAGVDFRFAETGGTA